MFSDSEVFDHTRKSADLWIREYVGLILRGRWIIIPSLVISLTAAFLYIQFKSPVFRAQSTVLINTGAVRSGQLPDLPTLGSERNLIHNVLEILQSNSLKETVAESLIQRRYVDTFRVKPLMILQDDPSVSSQVPVSMVDRTIGRLHASMSFSVLPGTDMIRVYAESKDPSEAALIANLFARSCYEMNLYHSRTKTRIFRKFLESQLEKKKKLLDQNEENLQEYMQQYGIASLDDETKRTVEQLSQLEAQRDEAEILIHSTRTTLNTYREQLAEQESSVARRVTEATDPYILRLQDEIAGLEVQRDIVVAQRPTSYVAKGVYDEKVKVITDQIALLRRNLKSRTEEFVADLLPGGSGNAGQSDPVAALRQLKQKILESGIQLQALTAKRDALHAVIDDYGRRLQQIPQRSLAYIQLKRAQLSSEKIYLSVQEKYNEAMIAEQSEFGYIEVIELAAVPGKPARPKRLLTLAVGVLCGLGFGLIAVFVREKFSLRVHTPDDLKKKGFTVISTITRANGAHFQLAGFWKKQNASSAGIPMLTHSMPFSPVAESYRQLRTSLFYSKNYPGLRTILVTSSKPGEGKSTTVANLGIVCAQSGKRVLLVDADFRLPMMHEIFGLPQSPGLSDILHSGGEPLRYVRQTAIDNLSLLPAGSTNGDPSEGLSGEKLRVLIDNMNGGFDFIFFDSSPVLVATETLVLASVVDATFVVVATGDTRVVELDHTCEILGQIDGKTPVFILNKFAVQKAFGMRYGSYSYGQYGYSHAHSANRREK